MSVAGRASIGPLLWTQLGLCFFGGGGGGGGLALAGARKVVSVPQRSEAYCVFHQRRRRPRGGQSKSFIKSHRTRRDYDSTFVCNILRLSYVKYNYNKVRQDCQEEQGKTRFKLVTQPERVITMRRTCTTRPCETVRNSLTNDVPSSGTKAGS